MTSSDIERIPFFGTTWYKRGLSYWVRRIIASPLMLLALLVGTLITGGAVGALITSKASLAVRVPILLAIGSGVTYSSHKAFKAFFRAERIKKSAEILRPGLNGDRAASRAARYGMAGSALAALARAGSALAAALLVISVVFSLGWFAVMFLWTLQKEYGIEHDARLRLEQKQRGGNPPDGKSIITDQPNRDFR